MIITAKDLETAAHPEISLAILAVLEMRFTCVSLGRVVKWTWKIDPAVLMILKNYC